jgi:hypothetical protein
MSSLGRASIAAFCNSEPGPRRADRGSVYVVTIVTLTVAMILGLALMQLAGNSTQSSQSLKAKMQLKHVAEAGIEYGYWYYARNRPLLPITVPNSLAGGQFTVTIEDYPSVQGTIKLTSTATVANQQLKRTYLMLRPTALPGTYSVFDYAICSDQSLVTSRPLITGTGTELDNHVNVNGWLVCTNSSSDIWGNVYASWGISSPYPRVRGTKIPSAAMLPFPDVDWNYYYSNRAWYYSGDKDFGSGITFPYDGAIVYVGGKLKLKGPISGRGIIVAQGDIEFNDSTWYATASSKAAFISQTKIKLPSGRSIVGLMYAHSSSFNATVEVPGSTTVTWGAVVGDGFNILAAGALTVVHDDDITADHTIGTVLHLPGY